MKTFWIILSLLFAIFITLYISQATGYYDYEQYKKVELTKDKIALFEQDVKEGNPIDIDNYMEHISYDYNNNVSRTGLKLSGMIKKYVKNGIDGTLDFLGLLFGD